MRITALAISRSTALSVPMVSVLMLVGYGQIFAQAADRQDAPTTQSEARPDSSPEASSTTPPDTGTVPPTKTKLVVDPVRTTLNVTAKRRIARQVARINDDFTPSGDQRTCVGIARIRETNPISDTQIWFDMRGKKSYLNTTNGKCIGLAQWDRFSFQTSLSQLCRGDIITVLDNFGVRIGSCGLGDFTEYQRIDRSKPDAGRD